MEDETDGMPTYEQLARRNSLLEEVAGDVLVMLDACGYGGKNKPTEKLHIKRLRA